MFLKLNLKNKLLLNSNNNNEKSIKIILNTNKKKSIYERNIKNEITKYSIKITSNVEVINLSNGKTDKFSVSNCRSKVEASSTMIIEIS